MFRSALMTAILAAFLAVSASPLAAATKKKESATKRAPTEAQLALRDRQKRCGAEWRTAKAAGKIEKGMKWPQYWSACNKRLKAM